MLVIRATDIQNDQADLPFNCLSQDESNQFKQVVARVNADRKAKGLKYITREEVILMLMRQAIKKLPAAAPTAPAQSPAPAQQSETGSEG